MFDVGFGELVLLFVIGLLVLGPQRLPKVAAELGKWIGRARRTANELRRQLEREIELSEITQPTPPPPAEAEPAALPPDPFSAQAQHGDAPQLPAVEDTDAPPAAPQPSAVEDTGAPPAEAQPEAESSDSAEPPSQSQTPVHSPPQH